MKGKIAFEEHMATDETVADAKTTVGDFDQQAVFTRQILDLGSERLERMDANGIDYAILSLIAPGIQGILDTRKAIEVARRSNDVLAEAEALHPNKYGSFAALPMQDPDAAAAELTRCVKELGFKGALVNGFTQKDVADSAIYYDIPEYRGFWATVAELDVPFYLHPRAQIAQRAQNYDGHKWMMTSPWGFAVETSIHALRLCGSGLFEDYPTLKICLGHLGENIPFGLDRMEERMQFSRRGYDGKRLPSDYFRENFHLTVSGNFSDPSFRCALDIMGVDKLSFSSDYPFEPREDGSRWFDASVAVDDATRRQVGRNNAISLFKLEDKFAKT